MTKETQSPPEAEGASQSSAPKRSTMRVVTNGAASIAQVGGDDDAGAFQLEVDGQEAILLTRSELADVAKAAEEMTCWLDQDGGR